MQISAFLPLFISGVGLFLLFELRFFFLLHPVRTAREMLSALKDKENRRSLCLALAGTLGVGNIFGVAAGIMIGGAGSLFWLLVSSVFSMVIKYAETLLAFDGVGERGGTSITLKRLFPRHGKTLCMIYAILTVLLSLFMGAALQSEALLDVAENTLSINPVMSALILLVLVMPCFVGGAAKIEKITEIIIPLTTIIYIIMCFSVILINFSRLSDAVSCIVNSALSCRSFAGGVIPIAIREGFSRGILSNEAGIGTSAAAHLRAKGRSPHIAGLFGILEVFFDSTLLCTLTGLSILVSVDNISAFKTPMSLVLSAFTSGLGSFSGYIVLVLIFAFAYATVICWYYYGSEFVSLYFSSFGRIFPIAYGLFLYLPAFFSASFTLYFTDVVILFMAILTLSAIIKGKARIAELSQISD